MKVSKYYLYKIINLTNGRYYIGRHVDNGRIYRGSGTIINQAYKKYGYDSFVFGILEYFETEESMIKAEIKEVTLDQVNNPKCYNLTEGGGGGIKGFRHTNESKLKMSNSRKKFHKENPDNQRGDKNHRWGKGKCGIDNPMYGKKPWNYGLTSETDERIKIGTEKSKLNRPDYRGDKNPNYGKRHSFSKETCMKMSESRVGKKRGPYKKRNCA